jgi:hypothetical protein
VNLIVLLSELEFCGFNGTIGKLIKSYLNDRYQRTLTNSNYSLGISDWQEVKVCHRVQYFTPYSSFYILMTCLI